MQHLLRHATAAGRDGYNFWDLDQEDKVVAAIRVASAQIVHVVIEVAHERARSRRRAQFAIWPVSDDGEAWAVEHGVYDAHLDPPHPLLPAMSLILANAPPEVAARLARLGAAPPYGLRSPHD